MIVPSDDCPDGRLTVSTDYPLSSIITSEFATTKWRGAMMGAVFAMQGIGQFSAAVIALIVTVGFKESLLSAKTYATCDGVCGLAVDKMWRVIIGFGAVPGCIALYFRLTIPETPRYTFDVARDVVKGGSDIKAYLSSAAEGVPDEITRVQTMRESAPQLDIPKASLRDFFGHYGQWKYGKVLLGTAGSWFFLDVAFYGVGLNNSTILTNIGYGTGKNVYLTFYNIAVGNIILVVAGAIPGYWVTVATVDSIGRKPIQLMGFSILTVLFCIIGFGYHKIGESGLFACYVLANFFFNFGPNSTTFIVPGECFPTRYRSTSHGISAASGKVGAIIAQVLIGPLRTRGAPPGSTASPWLNHVMEIYALFMLCGVFTTLLIPETKRLTLEQLVRLNEQTFCGHPTDSSCRLEKCQARPSMTRLMHPAAPTMSARSRIRKRLYLARRWCRLRLYPFNCVRFWGDLKSRSVVPFFL